MSLFYPQSVLDCDFLWDFWSDSLDVTSIHVPSLQLPWDFSSKGVAFGL